MSQISSIPVYEPYLQGNEKRYVTECLDTGWISSQGRFIPAFEAAVAQYTGMSHAVAVFNGTVALTVALAASGIGAGDEVLVPTFTYIASVNTIAALGAVPVFVESRPTDWLMDPDDLVRKISPRTKAIMPVHLYGFACDMARIRTLAERHGLIVIEDGAEALGVRVGGRHLGHDGRAITFSFFGNKTITCGEGGLVATNDAKLAETMRILRNHGSSPTRRYWHTHVGYNFRMTNLQAAIGLAQIEQIETIVAHKKRVYRRYREGLADLPFDWQQPVIDQNLDSPYWLVSLLAPSEAHRERICAALAADRVDTRPVFFCAHTMSIFADNPTIGAAQPQGFDVFVTAIDIARRGFSLPSYPGLSDADVARICKTIGAAV